MKDRFKRIFPAPLLWVLAAALANLVVTFYFEGLCWAGDTWSYILAIPNILAHGYDPYRTPAYPLAIWACQSALGDELGLDALLGLQCAFYLASIAALWHLLLGVSGRRWLATALAAFYAVAPGFAHYAFALITDSPATSLMALLLYFGWRLLRPGAGWGWAAAFAATLCVMLELRPSLGSVVPAAALLAGWLLYKRCAHARLCAALCALALVPAAGQVALMKHATGVMTPSIVSGDNTMFIALKYGNLTPDMADTPQLAARIDTLCAYVDEHGLKGYDGCVVMAGCHNIIVDLGLAAVNRANSRAGAPWCGLGQRVRESLDFHMLAQWSSIVLEDQIPMLPCTLGVTHAVLPWMKFWIVYAVLIVAAAVIVVRWARRRRMPVMALVAWLAACGMVASSLIFAPDHFDRLSLPAQPALLLLLAWMLRRPASERAGYEEPRDDAKSAKAPRGDS